ncbi:uncharacterized protein PFL1_00621 [Pseudozyma flocculosa PF-1]|uniref:Probable ribonuclease T1 n=1 Tax=Pseudozyma flocculosa TaxID=84751 RepID=A0A5C3EUA1_9BASI|nr:uncharacterized protein PFL1_00621 [Pseudozyma flocculosa PF-1]EPQ32425.1 hypothetical protein PFL1_00621 [Pseudozyma flocculosa PF-1]SPO34591.1 probable ribonuclease T1 [Pseudozyma flocculosa]
MQFKLALLALIPALAVAAPLEARQGGVSVTCGSTYYSSTQVNRAVNNAIQDAASSTTYPHTYNNYEGFDFSDYCSSGPFEEFPLVKSSYGYTGGSPGPDRVIYNPNTGRFCGAITHTGASNNAFVGCRY